MKVSIATSLLFLATKCAAFSPSFTKSSPFGVCVTTGSSQLFMSDEVDEIELDMEDRMSKSLDSLQKNLSTISTGRANPSMLDRVQVEYYGAPTPLNQLASISIPSSSQLQIEPYDKSSLKDVEKALILSDLGMTPSNDGSVIRLNIPALTEERRKELLKQCKAIGEEGKVAIRNVRRDGVEKVKKLEKDATISKDQSKDGQDMVQKLTDGYIKKVDEVVAKKEADVSKV